MMVGSFSSDHRITSSRLACSDLLKVRAFVNLLREIYLVSIRKVLSLSKVLCLSCYHQVSSVDQTNLFIKV